MAEHNELGEKANNLLLIIWLKKDIPSKIKIGGI